MVAQLRFSPYLTITIIHSIVTVNVIVSTICSVDWRHIMDIVFVKFVLAYTVATVILVFIRAVEITRLEINRV